MGRGARADEAFDRLTELASRHFGTPVSFVGLVDRHEEQFVVCRGADWSPLDREPREYSEDERAYLRLLADEAAEQLELRRRLGAVDGETGGDP